MAKVIICIETFQSETYMSIERILQRSVFQDCISKLRIKIFLM